MKAANAWERITEAAPGAISDDYANAGPDAHGVLRIGPNGLRALVVALVGCEVCGSAPGFGCWPGCSWQVTP